MTEVSDNDSAARTNHIEQAMAWMPRSPAAQVIVALALFWLIWATWSQRGGAGLGLLALIALVATIVTSLVAGVAANRSKPWQAVFLVMGLAMSAWLWFVYRFGGIRLVLWDLLAICLGCGVASVAIKLVMFAMRRWPGVHARLSAREEDFTPVICMFTGWLAISVVTGMRHQELPRDPGRFAAIGPSRSIVPEHAERWKDVRIGLALSGGGYRAAVFHAGTLSALEKLGLKPAVMSTVSGGSIIGSYYSLGGDPSAFKDAVADGRFNLKRELLLPHNALRLPFPLTLPFIDVKLVPGYEFSRRDVQASLIEATLLGDDSSWRHPLPGQPVLAVATTDLTFGQQVGLLADGAIIPDAVGGGARFMSRDWRIDQDFTLAQRVAISGGFPGAFPGAPARVVVGTGDGRRPLMLADGGIVDNSGYLLLRAADAVSADGADAHLRSDVFLVSDAGAIFGVEFELSGLGQLVRAADVSGAAGGVEARLASGGRKPQVSFSARGHFIGPDQQFRVYEGNVNQFSGEQAVVFAFDPAEGYPRAVLEAIVTLFPPRDRDRAAQAVANYWIRSRGQPPADPELWTRELSAVEKQNRCDDSEATPGICEALELRKMMLTLSASLLDEFRLQSTLDDLPSEERVDALFRLGQLLVYSKWPSLRSALDTASAPQSAN